jgi:hypothetical protein
MDGIGPISNLFAGYAASHFMSSLSTWTEILTYFEQEPPIGIAVNG